MPSNADTTHVPVRGGSDLIRQSGRAIVNPWGVVSSALRGDDGASIRGLFGWFAGEHEWVRADDDDLPLVYVRASDVTLNPWTKIDRALSGDPEASPVRMYHWIQKEFGLAPRGSRSEE